MGKGKKKISKKEFIERFTDLAVRHFSTMPPEEQERRLAAAERRLAKICRDAAGPTPSRTPETRSTCLAAQNPREDA